MAGEGGGKGDKVVGTLYRLGKPREGREERSWCFLLVVDAVKDEDETGPGRPWALFQELGQLDGELGEVFAPGGHMVLVAQGAGGGVDGGFKEVASGYAPGGLDQSVAEEGGVAVAAGERLEKGLGNGRLAGGLGAVED